MSWTIDSIVPFPLRYQAFELEENQTNHTHALIPHEQVDEPRISRFQGGMLLAMKSGWNSQAPPSACQVTSATRQSGSG